MKKSARRPDPAPPDPVDCLWCSWPVEICGIRGKRVSYLPPTKRARLRDAPVVFCSPACELAWRKKNRKLAKELEDDV